MNMKIKISCKNNIKQAISINKSMKKQSKTIYEKTEKISQ